jgi:cell division protein FtsI/penicillin-binding protein 2
MAALEEGVIKDGQIVTDCRGPLTIGHNTIHESHGYHGEVDCGALLEKSCNEGAAVLAMRLGADRFLPWCEKLGFGQKTGIELANESPGSLNKKNAKAKITLANMGFGQSLAVTPVQMAALYSAAANGGVWVQPHLIKSQQNPDGSWTATKVPRRRVCTPETAALLRKYLERVVSGKSGTGKAAAIAGYRIGGKTGTAEKAGLHGYREGKYIGSFIGVMPLEKPRLTIITVIDEPKLSHYGAVVACPAERAVALRALEYLNIPPTLPVKTSQDKH